MKTESVKVRGGGQELGEAEFTICETAEEAIEHYGEARMLALLNTQAKTTAANEFRRSKMDGDKLRVSDLKKLFKDLNLTEEAQAEVVEKMKGENFAEALDILRAAL